MGLARAGAVDVDGCDLACKLIWSVTVVEENDARFFLIVSFAVTVAVHVILVPDALMVHSLVVSKAPLGSVVATRSLMVTFF